MPLNKTILEPYNTKVLIWRIEENVEMLLQGLVLTENCRNRLKAMKSDWHKRGFLSVRQLLAKAGYSASQLRYDDNGKPYLRDGNYISITHSHQYAAIVISERPVGIDVEKQRDKILRIARKFTPLKEYKTVANDAALIRKLTFVWSAKEAVYKAMGIPGIGFLNHIVVNDFSVFPLDKTTHAEVNFQNRQASFLLNLFEFDGFTCVYTVPSGRS
ncbi:MAG TPA: 4'-phosphopantetheinyl transferase superfamily protein [Balneolaceae bacterium]|nr:4'-phosphopantetheinyl transferase superfamily protein [Balneolaceae bacterium]